MIKNRYAYLFVISQCNQNCFDCCNNYWMKKLKGQFSFEKLKSIDLSPYSNIFITGGEPGLLSKKEIDNISSYLLLNYGEKEIEVFTNGTNISYWPDKIHKLVHIIDYDIKRVENASYVIVITKKTDIKKVKSFLDKFGFEGVSIKNDSLDSLDKLSFKKVLNYLGLETNPTNEVQHVNNTKIEFETRCVNLKLDNSIFQHKLSLYRKCTCKWFNCLAV